MRLRLKLRAKSHEEQNDIDARKWWCCCWALVSITNAQQASPSPTPVDAGDNAGKYMVISTIEVGYRGLQVVGDLNKYQSDLNYRVGPRLFDSSFLLRAREGDAPLFETLLFTTSGWGADPSGNLRISVEKPEWYRFEGTYRKFKYFRALNSFANPNWVFSPSSFSVPPKPVTGEHGYNTETKTGRL